jgi:hypothetical protein
MTADEYRRMIELVQNVNGPDEREMCGAKDFRMMINDFEFHYLNQGDK